MAYEYEISTVDHPEADITFRESRTRLEAAQRLAESKYMNVTAIFITKFRDEEIVDKYYFDPNHPDLGWNAIGGYQ